MRVLRASGISRDQSDHPAQGGRSWLLDEHPPEAKVIGAVNTVRRDGDRLIGENTDGKGFLRSVREDAGVDPTGKRVVFLGAGGTARAMTVELALGRREPYYGGKPFGGTRGEALVRQLNEKMPVRAEFAPWDGEYAVPAERRHPGQRHVHRAFP